MTQKLAQLNARLDGKKTAVNETVTEQYKLVQKPALFNGYTRVYTPYKADGDGRAEQLPTENQMVQARFHEILGRTRQAWTELMDGTYSQDLANTRAKADIVVDGRVLAKDVPVTSLMFLKKQWGDVHTFLTKLPVPDASIDWVYDSNQGLLRAKEPETIQRTKKALKTLVKYPATDKHPAQTETYTEEVAIGEYTKTAFTGGCPVELKNHMVEAAAKVVEAIKVALEAANIATEAPAVSVVPALFDFVFAPLAKSA